MAFAGVELVAEFEVVETGVSAFVGGVNTPDEGVYGALWVMAFEPAEAELAAENEVDAPGPDDPEDALAWMYRLDNLLGSLWNSGSVSRITWYWLSCVYIVLICRWP
jgi:hypothetical protein